MNPERTLKACMWLVVAVGAYVRLRGLGRWPLAVDEYFTTQSVHNILQHGVPMFSSGGYYMRGLTLQYLIAPLLALGLSVELAGRLVTVACSFAVLPAVYLLGKRLSGVIVACVCVMLLSLSLSEIEFARYIRMYMPFQAVFLWYLLALQWAVIDRKPTAHVWLWLLSIAGVLTWKGGLFLLVLNFLPILIAGVPLRAGHVAVNGGLLILGYLYSSINFRFINGPPPFPPNVPVDLSDMPLAMPPVLASTLLSHPAWLIGALALFAGCLAAVFKLTRASGTVHERLAWAALIALSFINLFGCVLIALTLALLLGWLNLSRLWQPGTRVAIAPIAVCFVFWVAYALFTSGAKQLFPSFGPGGELSKLAVVLFKFPNVFDFILFPWFAAVPALTVVLVGLLVLALARAIWAESGEDVRSMRLVLAACLIMVALVGLIETKYIRTRYTFFLLPALYLIAVTAIHASFVRPLRSRPARGATLGLAILALVGVTEDFAWGHLVHLDRKDWNFRLPLNQTQTRYYYPRRDFRSPARYINRHAGAHDWVIAASQVVPLYLNHTNYFYWNADWGEFASFSCDEGRRERWSGTPLLYRQEQLFQAIDAAPTRTVWLIAMIGLNLSPVDALEQRYTVTLVHRGAAGVIGAYKITKPQ